MMHGLFASGRWDFLSTGRRQEKGSLKVVGSRFSTCEGTEAKQQQLLGWAGEAKCERASDQ